jgi:DNA-binding transcriptional ArsR family regulator
MRTSDVKKMKENAGQAAAFLSGLASVHRLRILCSLVEGEKSVTDLINATGIAQTSMSQHLGKLKEEGIVAFRREHRTLYYFIDHPLALDIIGALHDHFCQQKGRKK